MTKVGFLDPTQFPSTRTVEVVDWIGVDQIELKDVMSNLRSTLDHMVAVGRLRRGDPKNQSFGFAMAPPNASWTSKWDAPADLAWFTWGFGPDKDRYIANVLRKMRYSARTGYNSIRAQIDHGDLVRNPVDSTDEDGNLPWGDFAYGGAGFVSFGDIELLGGVSTFYQQDDVVAYQLILSYLGRELLAAQNRKFRPKGS